MNNMPNIFLLFRLCILFSYEFASFCFEFLNLKTYNKNINWNLRRSCCTFWLSRCCYWWFEMGFSISKTNIATQFDFCIKSSRVFCGKDDTNLWVVRYNDVQKQMSISQENMTRSVDLLRRFQHRLSWHSLTVPYQLDYRHVFLLLFFGRNFLPLHFQLPLTVN